MDDCTPRHGLSQGGDHQLIDGLSSYSSIYSVSVTIVIVPFIDGYTSYCVIVTNTYQLVIRISSKNIICLDHVGSLYVYIPFGL
jgi:hypothetical protein